MTTKPLTVREASEQAGVCDAVVRGWVTTGQLPHYRLGRRPGRGKILISQADLDAFLASRRVETPPPVLGSADPIAALSPPPGAAPGFAAYHRRIMTEIAQRHRRHRR